MRAHRYKAFGFFGLALIVGSVSAAPMDQAFARWGGRHAAAVERGYVIAHSRFGNGSVEGAVRNTTRGAQVQKPSGNWEFCRRSCSETLRVETIDYWDSRQQNLVSGFNAECGIFGCLDIGVGY